tara:strand:- start:680 stop:847 length:168 start_codon:yes stop_codon:yes gene_type:complete
MSGGQDKACDDNGSGNLWKAFMAHEKKKDPKKFAQEISKSGFEFNIGGCKEFDWV